MTKLKFNIEQVTFIEPMADSHFATARLEAFSSGANRHDTFCTEETLRAMASSIEEKPIIFEMEYGDFGAHSAVTVPAGFVEPGTIDFMRREDGRLTLVVMAKIWKEYSGQFLETFEASGGTKSVSVEMFLRDPQELTPGAELKIFEFSAVCVLGEFYTPASPDAKMDIISFARKKETEYKELVMSEFGRYRDVDFSIPENVKENACKGLELNERFGYGKSTDLAIAKFLRKNKSATPDRVRNMCKTFSKFASLDLSDKESESWTRFQLWGGGAGKDWSAELETTMTEIDEKGFRYFEVDILDDEEEKSIVAEKNKEKEKETAEEFVEEEKSSTEEAVSEEDASTEDFSEENEEENFAEEEKPEDKEEMAEDDSEEDEDDKDGEGEETSNMEEGDSPDFEAQFAELTEKYEALEAENVELREFKSGVEQERFEFEVNALLKEVQDVYPADELEKARERASEFTLETLAGFKNEIRAKAFEFAKNKPEGKEAETDGYVRASLPFKKQKDSASIW